MNIKIINKLATGCYLVCAVFQNSFAQGTSFTYQGRLNDNQVAANGSYDLAFSLFATNTAGMAIAGPVTSFGVAISNGLFTTAVDFGAAFTGGNNWLEIAVSTNGADSFSTLSPRQQLTPVPYASFANTASNVVGTLPAASLAGDYGNAVTLDNSANNFTGAFNGDGSDLNSVNAYSVNGLTSANLWQLGGNSGANPANGAFLGTKDPLPLEFWVNTNRALRLEYANDYFYGMSPNMIGGFAGNSVSSGSVGDFIGGGGNANSPNRAYGYYCSILGGIGNVSSSSYSTAMGCLTSATGYTSFTMGYGTTASGQYSTAMGKYSVASGDLSTAMGAYTTASGTVSTAMGYNAVANFDKCFVWSDGTSFSSTAANQFMIHASGGAQVYGGGMAVCGASSPNYPGAKGVFIENGGAYGAVYAFDYTVNHTLPLCLNSPGGFVGIGTTSPNEALSVYGNADKPGGGSWDTFSDARLKDIGENFTPSLAALLQIQPVHYHYKADNALKLPSKSEYIGVVAQQLQQAVPEAVQTNASGYLTVNNDPVLWTMLNAIKEVNKKLEQREFENAELKQSVGELKKLVQSLAAKQ